MMTAFVDEPPQEHPHGPNRDQATEAESNAAWAEAVRVAYDPAWDAQFTADWEEARQEPWTPVREEEFIALRERCRVTARQRLINKMMADYL